MAEGVTPPEPMDPILRRVLHYHWRAPEGWRLQGKGPEQGTYWIVPDEPIVYPGGITVTAPKKEGDT